MSVVKSHRKEAYLDVIIKAKNLASYTIKITKNQKMFPPEYNNGITNRIIDTATQIYMDCWTANNIYVGKDENGNPKIENLQERLWLQERARLKCNELLALIQLAKEVFHLKSKRVQFWGSNTLEVRNKIKAWNESDRKRFLK